MTTEPERPEPSLPYSPQGADAILAAADFERGLLELYGANPRPFLRPAMEEIAPEVLARFQDEFAKAMQQPLQHKIMPLDRPSTVYAVCVAEYEDNAPVAAFAMAELAEAHIVALKSEPKNHLDYEVRPLRLCDHEPVKVERYHGHGHLRADGTITYGGYRCADRWDYEIEQEVTVTVTDHDNGFTHVVVNAPTAERAKAEFDAAIAERLRIEADGNV